MADERTLNFLGALALGFADSLNAAVEASAGHGGETPAALGACSCVGFVNKKYVQTISALWSRNIVSVCQNPECS